MRSSNQDQSQLIETRTGLAALAQRAGLVLLYHGVWPIPPAALGRGVHNVSPETLGNQLELLKAYFTVVSVDEFAAAKDPRGLAAVTFDDGYRAINEYGLPVFEALDVPFTVYLNGSSFRGRVFWRDKIRFIDESNLVTEFERNMRGIDSSVGKRFYRYTKHPSNNSRLVTQAVDRFLESRGLLERVHRDLRFCFQSISELVSNPLVSYGNHSESHFVMSSLSAEQQYSEINRTQKLLNARRDINVSSLFSIPFGADGDFGPETIDAAARCGYRGVLLSRARAHHRRFDVFNMPAFERFMPREDGLLASVTLNERRE